MAVGSTFWSYIAPVDRVSLGLNPSYELGTVGAFAIQSAVLGSTSGHQQFGAFSLTVAPTSNGTSGAVAGTWTAGNGTDYTVSAYVNGVNGVAYMIGVGDSNGVNLVGSTAFTGGGTWQRYSFSYSEASGVNRSVVVRKTSGNNAGTYYVDGWQAEVGSITSYFDGDTDGCLWLGVRHASQSYRSGQVMSGGSVIPLSAIGLTPLTSPGIGMPPVVNTTQSYAQIAGAQFQGQRTDVRSFTLTALAGGTTWGDFHITRRAIIDAFKIDVTGTQQPVRFWYTGANGTVQIDAVYSGGLDFGQTDGFTENIAVKFTAFDNPYWAATTWEGTTLAPRTAIGSTNFIAQRSPSGQWGSVAGANGTSVVNIGATNSGVKALAYHPNGTLYVGGDFGTAGGTRAPNIAFWSKTGSAWGTLGGGATGTVNNTVSAIALTPTTQIFFGGTFNQVAGTTAHRIASWDGAFGTLTGGTISTAAGHQVYSLLYAPIGNGTLFVGGTFATAGGTTAPHIAIWNMANWGTLQGGTLLSALSGPVDVLSLTLGYDLKLYLGGLFDTAGGTTVNSFTAWNGAYSNLGGGVRDSGAAGIVNVLRTEASGNILIAGQFQSSGGITTSPSVAEWNGVAFNGLGSGVGLGGVTPSVYAAIADPSNGRITVTGLLGTAGGVNVPDGAARFSGLNGAGAWTPIDIDLPGQGGVVVGTAVTAMTQAPDTTLYIGGYFYGTAQAASIGTVVNHGRAVAYPIIRLSLPSGSGTAALRQIANTTTGAYVFFNLSVQAGETLYLTTTPGNRSFTSSFRGNVFGGIVPGSNLSTFNLLPGTNTMSFFSDNDSLQVATYWQPRSWSADGGTSFI